jgi:flagellar hook assembly protein FlgD
MTPNGDGINDELAVSYSLYGLPEQVSVALSVYALDGRRVAELLLGAQRSGAQTVRWDGRDENGQLLAPGVYLVAVAVQSEQVDDLKMSPLGIAY